MNASQKDNIPHEQISMSKRLMDSQPILKMMDTLSRAGYKSFQDSHVWETCLCALILTLEPKCGFERILNALPASTAQNSRGMDEVDFLNTFAHMGYYCRKANCALNHLDHRLLPAVFIPQKGVPCIILKGEKESTLNYYDPVSMVISTTPPSLDQEGKIWFFQKYDEHRASTSKFMRKGSGHSWFRALLGRFKGTYAQILTAGLILNIIALITPLFIMMVYDRVIAARSIETLPMLAIGVFVAIFFEWRLRAIRSRGLSWLAGRLDNVVGNKIFSHLVSLPPSMIESASVTAQIARIKTFESVRDFFSGSMFLSILETPFVFLSLIAVTIIAGPLALVPIAMILGYIALFYFMRNRIKIAIRLAAKASSMRQQFTIETFEKLEGIRGHGLSKHWIEKFRHLSGREMMTHFKLGWLGMVAENIANMLTVISAVLTVGFGTHLIWSGSLSSGALVASMILVWRILTPFYSLCTMIPRLEQLRNSIIQINDLMDIETEEEKGKAYASLPFLKGKISLQNVDFQYEGSKNNIINNLSFSANPGDTIAITGENGSGKATVLKLIKALYEPTGGNLRIDGFDIRQLNENTLRKQIAYVAKTPYFFHGTVIQNMHMANAMASEEDIVNALKLANVWEDVQSLPDGLNSYIGSSAKSGITNSLAFRLSLARAYLSPAKILLIDELPNTLLSSQTGKNLKDYIARSKGKRTVVFCTYREDFMRLADKIVWLRNALPPVAGPRQDVMDKLNKKEVAA